MAIIVPVSKNEPKRIVEESAKYLRSLDAKAEIIYVFDGDERDERVEILRRLNCKVIARNDSRGKRAGAINDAISYLKKTDFIAIFDIDSRPSKDVIENCLKALKNNRKTYIASAKRFVVNKINLLTKTIDLEYRLINFFLKKSKFKQFNGLIGVLNGEILRRERLNEDAITEDADFATRMHIKGYKAVFCEGYVYEQAPICWKDFYNQRKRWYFGGLQLWKYFKNVLRSKDISFKLSWLSSLTITFFPLIFFPLIILSLPSLLIYKKSEGFKLYLGLIAYCLTLQLASLSAIAKMIKGDVVEWVAIKRSLEA